MAESLAYDDELRKGGHYLYSGALQSVQTATTIRIQSGVQLTDGPFAETKEQVGGFIVIEAHDLDERSASLPRSRRSASGASRSARSRNWNHIVNNVQSTVPI